MRAFASVAGAILRCLRDALGDPSSPRVGRMTWRRLRSPRTCSQGRQVTQNSPATVEAEASGEAKIEHPTLQESLDGLRTLCQMRPIISRRGSRPASGCQKLLVHGVSHHEAENIRPCIRVWARAREAVCRDASFGVLREVEIA